MPLRNSASSRDDGRWGDNHEVMMFETPYPSSLL